MIRKLNSFTMGLALVGALLVGAPAAHAEGQLEGKVLTLIVPHSGSGMYAVYSQVLAPAIARHLKAQDVRIEHRSGAGGLVGSNLVWAAEPDGLTFGLSSGTSLMLAQLADAAGVQFDATQFTYLGRPTADDRVIIVGAESQIDGAEGLGALDRPFVMPSQGVDDDFYAMALIGHTMGFDVTFVTGYEGAADTTLAVIRGDADGRLTSWPSALSPITAGEVRPLITIGNERHPDFPDVPTALEFAIDDERRAVMRALINIQALHRSFFGPPGIDPAIASELRDAIMAAMTDPEVIRAAAQVNAPLDPMHGAQQQELIGEIYRASGEIPPILKAAVEAIQ
jgi:tripartite-type tricarboxylate transporter receptor subunit TctC